MKKATESIQNNNQTKEIYKKTDIRECPSCGMMNIKGMPGGRDATCTNCGYKDPCCYD